MLGRRRLASSTNSRKRSFFPFGGVTAFFLKGGRAKEPTPLSKKTCALPNEKTERFLSPPSLYGSLCSRLPSLFLRLGVVEMNSQQSCLFPPPSLYGSLCSRLPSALGSRGEEGIDSTRFKKTCALPNEKTEHLHGFCFTCTSGGCMAPGLLYGEASC